MSALFDFFLTAANVKINLLCLRITVRKSALPFYSFFAKKRNRELLMKALRQKDNRPPNINFLFIVDSILGKGGVETRTQQYAELLTRAGYNVHFLTGTPLTLADYQHYPCYHLNFFADNFSDLLITLIKKKNIKKVEFHFKSDAYLKNIDIDELKKHVQLGCVIHGRGSFFWDAINKLDYRIVISEQLYRRFNGRLKDHDVVYNSVQRQKVQWRFKGQKTALYISRLSSDKTAHVKTFIRYCLDRSLQFHIAGAGSRDYDLKSTVMRAFPIGEERFIGEINTLQFLKKNCDNYLFVAGVGLVAIEAGMFNYPVFLTSARGVEDSTFISRTNFHYFNESNFTIFDTLGAPRTQDLSRLEDYTLGDKFACCRDIEKTFSHYLDVINRTERQ